MDGDSDRVLTAMDKDLRVIEDLVVRMGGMVEEQIEQSVTVLLTMDTGLGDQVETSDKKIDELQSDIDQRGARLIALRQPTAQDLRAILAAMKIASDLERIGDHAKNMAKRTHVLSQLPSVKEAPETVQRVCVMVRKMIKDALDAYIARNADVANEVRERDEEVDEVYNSLFRILLTYMLEDARLITPCMHLLFIAKNVERMGDLVTSITEQVHFIVHGKMPPDDRPKGDVTSTTLIGGEGVGSGSGGSGGSSDSDVGSGSGSGSGSDSS